MVGDEPSQAEPHSPQCEDTDVLVRAVTLPQPRELLGWVPHADGTCLQAALTFVAGPGLRHDRVQRGAWPPLPASVTSVLHTLGVGHTGP